VDGLFLEGAGWDLTSDSLVDQSPGRLFFPMYVIHFLPTENLELGDNFYSCPCYKTSVRAGVLSTTGQSTNFILPVNLFSKTQPADFWTLRATALLCQLDN
jgi:dynein heavy chain